MAYKRLKADTARAYLLDKNAEAATPTTESPPPPYDPTQ